ncbi:MAG: AAA family ATPase [Dysgonamonadaceae bacterium]|jgi:predicted AAA+ superfamily ATPase|nr:AAA family ATPase [Dysgonamonadaceae bacterium]
MERKLMSELIKWKDRKGRKPLLLEGARQVGKTYLLKDFGKRYFNDVAYVNFQNPSQELVELFNGSISPERIITMLELMLNMKISPSETLLIFDEVQEVPRALTSLKYFCEDAPEYHIATAGSLLGIFLHKDTSFPVGKVNTLKLEPMNFEEFLWANERENIVTFLKSNPFETTFNEILSDLFKQYLYIGGMPEAVADWIENKDVTKLNEIQEEILSNYRKDFIKHTDNTTAVRIRQLFDSLPAQFAKKNDKFLYGTIKEGARAREYEMAIEWLIDAGIVRRVNQVSCGNKIPLKSYTEFSAFKLYFVDVGLFRFLAEIPFEVIADKTAIFDEFNGLIAEQFVLQQLAEHTLYYWTSGEKSEVDFVMQFGSEIVPIEVKSGENVKAKSLKIFREKYAPKISVRFSLKNTRLDNDMLNISLFNSFLCENLLDLSSGKCVKQ